MIREIVKIDEDLCDGCGLCIPNCHEGALQIIDNKAVLVSDLMCDGLGACLGHCPLGAITIEKREAAPYDEVAVVKDMIPKGINVMVAHLVHLKEHNEQEFFLQALNYLEANQADLGFDLTEMRGKVHQTLFSQATSCGCSGSTEQTIEPEDDACGCSGSAEQVINQEVSEQSTQSIPSALTHWPVQMHLINPNASYFRGSDLLIAADGVAYSMGDFHSRLLKGKTLTGLCPKLDSNTDIYIQKIVSLIDDAKVNTITVARMEVPCCGGLLRFVQQALQIAKRKVPVKVIIVSVAGKILEEEWL